MIATHIREQLSTNLPFVAYRKPNGTVTKLLIQNDNKLHTVTDFTESGFIFAPFDNDSPIIRIPFDASFEETFPSNMETMNNSTAVKPSAEAKIQHMELVAKGVATIQSSEISKIVLSRKENVHSNRDALAIFTDLLQLYPTAFVYLWFHPKVGMWTGATPETLVSVQGNFFNTMSLAGTRKATETESVQWTQKEREEQQIVTDYIVSQIDTISSDVYSSETETHRAGSLWHLRTKISGKLNATTTVGDLIKRLHPTPAICGFPMESAKAFILQNEQYDRSFYTGFLGELNLQKAQTRNRNRKNQENSAYRTVRSFSDIYVNLRCMQITDSEKQIYIGGGITAASDPEAEWEETVAKSQIMKRVL